MEGIFNGETFQLVGGDNPLYAEYLNTKGRKGFRVTDRFGRGVCLEGKSMERLGLLLDIALGVRSRSELEGEFL